MFQKCWSFKIKFAFVLNLVSNQIELINRIKLNYKSRKYMIYIKFKVQSEKRINNDSNEIPSC